MLPDATLQATALQREIYGHADNLLRSPDFQWFLKEGLGATLSIHTKRALDPKLTPLERDYAVHVAAALAEVRDWTENRRKVAGEIVEKLNR